MTNGTGTRKRRHESLHESLHEGAAGTLERIGLLDAETAAIARQVEALRQLTAARDDLLAAYDDRPGDGRRLWLVESGEDEVA